MYVCAPLPYSDQRPKEASDTLNGCEPSCGPWELNLGSLEEQQVLLTARPALRL